MNNSDPFLSWAHPLVQEWFLTKVGTPTEPQRRGWPSILAGEATLISAPTGSGKTFAAFLTCIDSLVKKALTGQLSNQIDVVYVSPLKALSNDIHKNLMEPLQEITALATQKGLKMQEIRIAVRTGDTLPKERQAMLKNPPHILVTTPESLYILLTAEKSRLMLMDVKTVIVDEIHAMANDKRGSHLTLSLERLAAMAAKPPVRIGLSATQKPLETVGAFLVGAKRALPNIIDIGHARHLEINVEVPASELGAVASNEMWDEIYNRLAELAQQNRSTLVFVNTRKLAERVAHHLTERLGENQVTAHHGSLSRKLRLAAETRLKNGELKVLVATASLELGIDIGSIDLVCQIGSPRAIAVALQRIGRAGHWHGAISKGKIFATTRDELMECAALVYAIKTGDLDQLIIPVEPLDILTQQIIAICATGDWQEDDLFSLVTQAYPYKDLTKETFNTIIEMLSEGVAGSRGRYGAYLHRDQVNNIVKARRGARLNAIMSGGAIPENGLFTVIAEPHGVMIGTLDEDFAVESNKGDIILLGTTSWKIRRVEAAAGKVLVEDAHGAPPSVPFWRGEAPARTIELSYQVSAMRQNISDRLDTPTVHHWLKESCHLDDSGAQQLIEYIKQGKALLGAVPTQKRIIAERFFDEAGGMQLIIHAPFGARINKAWGLALRKRFCRSFNFELQAAATDDGLNIALAEQHSFPLSDVFHFLHPNTLKEVLIQAVLQAPLFNTRWRWVATRSLALLRFRNGKKIPPNILRMLADDLLAAVFPDAAACQDNLGGKEIELPTHPLIDETMKDILTEALDVEGLLEVIKNIMDKNIECIAIDAPLPSVFSHEILNANPYAYLDDAPLEERRARAVEMRRVLPEKVLQEIGKLDPEAITEVQKQAWPDIRNADELHDLLLTLLVLPVDEIWQGYYSELEQQQRVATINIDNIQFWVAAEKYKTVQVICPNIILHNAQENFLNLLNNTSFKNLETKILSREDAILHITRGWAQHLGPFTVAELAQKLLLAETELNAALIKLETTGLILRGQFRTVVDKQMEWCERRLLARIHRLTLGKLRKEIEPVTAAQYMRWLLNWQHLAPGTQLQGENGLVEVIKQLQGFEIPAKAWERKILAKRLKDYDPDMLDRLCLLGVIGWGRLSPHPAMQTADAENYKKRIMPTSVAPITFFLREESQWMIPHVNEDEISNLSAIAQQIYQYLKNKGASFFPDIVKGVAHLKAEVENGLWELVAAGLITADGFDNLRALIDPRRRLDKKYKKMRTRYASGRWSLLHTEDVADTTTYVEAACWMLLKRYGVVFRDVILREKNIPSWRELLLCFRRLEDRGEIRGGRFISGFLGEQFALPYAVDSLRAIKSKEKTDIPIKLSAVDPLNLIGTIIPGERVSSSSKLEVLMENIL